MTAVTVVPAGSGRAWRASSCTRWRERSRTTPPFFALLGSTVHARRDGLERRNSTGRRTVPGWTRSSRRTVTDRDRRAGFAGWGDAVRAAGLEPLPSGRPTTLAYTSVPEPGAPVHPLYDRIRQLRDDEGLMWREVADRVGMTKSRANEVYLDPTGVRARERKTRRSRPCLDCKRPVSNSGSEPPERCNRCRRRYTAESMEYRTAMSAHARGRGAIPDTVIVAALREYAVGVARPTEDGYDAWRKTRPPGAVPATPTILNRYRGSWNAALIAAGVEAPEQRRYGRPLGSGRWSRADAARIVADCGRAVGHLPTITEYGRGGSAVATSRRMSGSGRSGGRGCGPSRRRRYSPLTMMLRPASVSCQTVPGRPGRPVDGACPAARTRAGLRFRRRRMWSRSVPASRAVRGPAASARRTSRSRSLTSRSGSGWARGLVASSTGRNHTRGGGGRRVPRYGYAL
jgi:hypothetical protein